MVTSRFYYNIFHALSVGGYLVGKSISLVGAHKCADISVAQRVLTSKATAVTSCLLCCYSGLCVTLTRRGYIHLERSCVAAFLVEDEQRGIAS